jgi:uncharacterized protein YcbX
MAGEQLESVDVTDRGLDGDRAYALADTSTNKVGSAKNVKRFGDLLKWRAEYRNPGVCMTTPDGRVLHSDHADIDAQLAALFGDGVSFISRAPQGMMLQFAAGTLGGKHASTTELPVSSGAPEGTLFNYAAVHLVTTATLRALNHAAVRFRPNVIVDTGNESGFPENAWPGRTITIGSGVELRVSIPCPRCVITTLPRNDLPLDASVLNTIAERNTVNLGDFGDLPCVGVYAEVVRYGQIRRGDSVQIL